MKLLYLYYNQPEAIANLKRIGLNKSPFEIIIIDDGSNPKLNCDWATVYRIEENVPWNMSRANNLGFSKLKENDIVLRLDIDHWFSLEDLERLSKVKLNSKEIVKFERVVVCEEKTYKTEPPPNIYMARVGDLVSSGGYDERFCGNYGYEDKELMHRLDKKGFKEIISEVLVKTKASLHTKGLNRDLTINRELYLELIKPNDPSPSSDS